MWYVLTFIIRVRFNYTYYDKKHGAIYKSIEALDRMGMDIVETGDPDAFKQYLLEYDNTICGRHPISVFLHVSLFRLFIVFIYMFFVLERLMLDPLSHFHFCIKYFAWFIRSCNLVRSFL